MLQNVKDNLLVLFTGFGEGFVVAHGINTKQPALHRLVHLNGPEMIN